MTGEGLRKLQPALYMGIALVCLTAFAAPVCAETDVGIEWSGKIFMNFLHSDTDQIYSSYSATGRPNEAGGFSAINSELELSLRAHVTEYLIGGARIKSRFRENYWTSYWDNKDLEEAQYMKLRNVFVHIKPPNAVNEYLEWVQVGATDWDGFSPWTVGKIRYIDRDNASAVICLGKWTDKFKYRVGALALPSVWAGPGYTTAEAVTEKSERGIFKDPFSTEDFAYAGRFDFFPLDTLSVGLAANYVLDREFNPEDTNVWDGADTLDRYRNTVASLEMKCDALDFLAFSAMAATAEQDYRAQIDYIARGGNIVPQKDVSDQAYLAHLDLNDPFGVGLTFKAEYFRIGDDYISILSARRETDVLMMEGWEGDDCGWDRGGWSGTTGQTPNLGADNGDAQFTEDFYQSVIGWHGATGLTRFDYGNFSIDAEYSHIDYLTNMQGRSVYSYAYTNPQTKEKEIDVRGEYPQNLGYRHIYNKDYGSLSGWQPDLNVYHCNQEKKSKIAVVRGKYHIDFWKGFDLGGRVKYILDEDSRNLMTDEDDYRYEKWVYDVNLGCQVGGPLYMKGGITYYDKEMDKTYFPIDGLINPTVDSETKELIMPFVYMNWNTEKWRYYYEIKYNFGGAKLVLLIEDFEGEDYFPETAENRDFHELRSRAYLEVSF